MSIVCFTNYRYVKSNSCLKNKEEKVVNDNKWS